jgi:hypothetical protein
LGIYSMADTFSLGAPRTDSVPARRPYVALWVVVVALATVDVLWLPFSKLSIHWAFLLIWFVLGAVCLGWWGAGFFIRMSEGPRAFALGLAFLWIGAKSLQVFGQLVMTLPLPIADTVLTSWDVALGFDWVGYLSWVAAKPALMEMLERIYGLMTPVSLLAFVFLHFSRKPERAWDLLALSFSAGLIATLVGIAFPAMGAVTHLQPPGDLLAALRPNTGAEWVRRLTLLRSGQPVDVSGMVGLVSFPSYHVAHTMIVAWCLRGFLLFPFAVVFAAGTAAAAPIMGGHYFVDLIAGAALALSLVLMSHARSRGRSQPA